MAEQCIFPFTVLAALVTETEEKNSSICISKTEGESLILKLVVKGTY